MEKEKMEKDLTAAILFMATAVSEKKEDYVDTIMKYVGYLDFSKEEITEIFSLMPKGHISLEHYNKLLDLDEREFDEVKTMVKEKMSEYYGHEKEIQNVHEVEDVQAIAEKIVNN